MGVVGDAKRDATRVANGSKPPQRVRKRGAIGTEITGSDMEDFLAKFPIELRRKVLTKGVRKAAAVVRTNARTRVRRSEDTGTRKGWSAAVRQKRALTQTNLRKSVGTVMRQYEHVVYAAVGPRGVAGAHGWIYEHGANIYLWGKQRYQLKGTPFLRPAADATLTEQQAAIVGTLKREWTQA